MSYSRRFYYKRVLEAQFFVRDLQEKHKGVPLSVIYREWFKERYHVSYATFNRWMGVPAAVELRKLREKEMEQNSNKINNHGKEN